MIGNLLVSSVAAVALGMAPDFGPPTTYEGYGPFAIADFNGDGKPDVAVAAGDVIKTWLGVGDGTFQPPIYSSPGASLGGDSLAVGDFNGDGIPDLVTQAVYEGEFFYVIPRILLGVGDGTFRPFVDVNGWTSQNSITVGDLNGDKASDLIVTWSINGWDGPVAVGVTVLLNDGRGGFSVTQSWDNNGGLVGYPGRVLLADFNRDGVLDMALQQIDTSFGAEQYVVHFHLGNGDGTFRLADIQTYVNPNPNGGFPEELYFFGDFDNDGATDVACGATLFMGRGDGTFSPGAALTIGEATADFDGDGNLDIVGVSNETPLVNVFLGVGNGSFVGPRPTLTYSDRIQTADFNGDGRPDVASMYNGLTILLNDGNWTGPPPSPALTISNQTATEGDSGTSSATFLVRLSFSSTLPISVQYATTPSPVAPQATPGVDYLETNGVLTFAPGEREKTISVPVVGDLLTEPIYEYFCVTLSNPTNATIANGQGLCAIYSEESPPVIDISNVSKSEGDNGNTKFVFQVTLSAPIYQTVTVSYRTVDGTATVANRDYSAANGTLTFSPGERTKTINVQVRGDRNREADEVFYVDLFNPSTNASIGRGRGTGAILNDD